MMCGVSKIIDLRSDTVTLPTDEMRRAMANAQVGDDVFGEDPTVQELERIAAEMFEKEAAVYVPSGTMGNLICALTHCWERSSLVYVGDKSHMLEYEQGGMSQFGGIIPRSLRTNPDGTFDVDELFRVHRSGENYHHSKPRMIAIENPISGKVLPLSHMKEVHDAARSLDLKIHLDGARIGNAIVKLGCKPREITRWADSVTVCLSKGLGAPVGSVVVGSAEFIGRARRMRKALGGGMRQCGIIAASGIISLTKMMDRLQEDHDHATKFAEAVNDYGKEIFNINMADVQTNMVVFTLKDDIHCSVDEFLELMSGPVNENETVVKMSAPGNRDVRAVFHNGISSSDVDGALRKLQIVCEKILRMK